MMKHLHEKEIDVPSRYTVRLEGDIRNLDIEFIECFSDVRGGKYDCYLKERGVNQKHLIIASNVHIGSDVIENKPNFLSGLMDIKDNSFRTALFFNKGTICSVSNPQSPEPSFISCKKQF